MVNGKEVSFGNLSVFSFRCVLQRKCVCVCLGGVLSVFSFSVCSVSLLRSSRASDPEWKRWVLLLLKGLLHSLFFLSTPLLLVNFQSFRQTEWIPVGELHLESGLHPWRNGRPAEPLSAATRSPRVWAERLIEAGVSGIRVQAETMWLASSLAGSHSICWSHYRKRRCYHSEHHQTDPV